MVMVILYLALYHLLAKYGIMMGLKQFGNVYMKVIWLIILKIT